MTSMENLFGASRRKRKPCSLRVKVIRPVFEWLTIGEDAADYLNGPSPLNSFPAVAEMFAFLRRETKEHFLTLHLDSKNKLVCIDNISAGSMSASIVHPREVFKSVLLSSASALILVHNHPSGDPTPSREDLEITQRLKGGADLLGIRLLDHVIIGDHSFSFSDRGMM
jgi:DNA repair protein RadC